jgi:TatD DNase family protein
MNLIDTHTHLYLPAFDSDRGEVVTRAVKEGVSVMLLPNIDRESFPLMMQMANDYRGVCLPMAGLHPTSVSGNYTDELEFITTKAMSGGFVAIGEIGIDLYWDKKYIEEQMIAFKKQLDLALLLDLPVVIHSRESFGPIFEVLSDYRNSRLRGVFHAFTGGTMELRNVLDAGFMIGAGGIVTFKNSGLPQTIAGAGLENIVLETDSPYLTPSPHRGQRNESSYISFINFKISTLFGVSREESAAITTENAIRLFKLHEHIK